MQQKITASPDFTVRPMTDADERRIYRRFAHITFNHPVDIEAATDRRMAFTEQQATYRPELTRGAFLGNTFLGGYNIAERKLCISPSCSSHLLTTCIGAVVTLPEYRQRGIAVAMLNDAIAFAQTHKHALLLLHGIPNFYHRFGFVDVLEDIEHTISRQLIEAQPTSPYTIRNATPDDTPVLLDIYKRHYGSYTGSFGRDETYQKHLIRHRFNTSPAVVLDTNNIPRGYIVLLKGGEGYDAIEVAADDWLATLALLQHHLHINVELNNEYQEISWPLPLNSRTFYMLADSIHTETRISHTPDAGWMARVGDVPTLVEAMIPAWKTHWLNRSHTLEWSGTLAISIDDAGYSGVSHFLLGLDATGVYLLDQMTSTTHAAHTVRISQQMFMQLIFGHRPVSWAARQQGQHIPENIQPILNALFPTGNGFIPGSDAF